MKCRKTETHIIYVKIPVTGILSIDHFNSAFLFSFPAFVDNEKIATGKYKFFYCLRCPFIVLFRRFLPEAGSFTYTYMILETGSACFVET